MFDASLRASPMQTYSMHLRAVARLSSVHVALRPPLWQPCCLTAVGSEGVAAEADDANDGVKNLKKESPNYVT